MALAFLFVIVPNLWWLVENDFQPFRYVDGRAVEAAHWYQLVTFPLRWTVSQFFYLVPTIVLIAVLCGVRLPKQSTAASPFVRRYVTALALGPFLVTTAIFGVLGRLSIAMWGYPLWSFAPLAFLMWFTPSPDGRALRRFATAIATVFVVWPLAYAADELLEPMVRDRQKATHFPGRAMAELVTRRWREVTGTPLRYVSGAPIARGGGEFAANNVAVYAPDRPHVLVDGDPKLSPWIDMADFDRTGGVLVWQSQSMPDALRARFPQAQPQPPIVLPPLTLVPRSPAVVQFAIVPPRRMLSAQ